MQNIHFGDIRYNAQAGAFEARVDIRRGGTTFRYPCQIAGPVTMNMDDVRTSLAHKAIRMSDSGTSLMSYL